MPHTSHFLQQVTNSSDEWTISGIPASQHHLTLTRLDPGSLYEVEMAAYNCAGEGQTAMVTFRTGECPALPPAWGFRGPELSYQARCKALLTLPQLFTMDFIFLSVPASLWSACLG